MTQLLTELISPEYGLVLLAAVILAFEVVLFGAIFPGRLRKQIFSKNFMKQHFGKIHANEVRGEIKAEGYPDMGNGRYSEKLSYADWFKFNSAQRAHINFVESIASYEILLLVGGLYNPILAAGFGGALVVGRLLYGIGYLYSPSMRVPGALINAVSLLGLTALSGLAAWTVVGKRKWF